jgi:hypothetical protein
VQTSILLLATFLGGLVVHDVWRWALGIRPSVTHRALDACKVAALRFDHWACQQPGSHRLTRLALVAYAKLTGF